MTLLCLLCGAEARKSTDGTGFSEFALLPGAGIEERTYRFATGATLGQYRVAGVRRRGAQ